jgi:hypothetical protein
VTCDTEGALEGHLEHNKIKVYQDSLDKCLLHVEAKHASGCPTYERRGIDQYITSHPTIIGLNILMFGLITLLLCGKWIDFVMWGTQFIFVFLIFGRMLSSWGAFDWLEDHSTHTAEKMATTIIWMVLLLAISNGCVYFFITKMGLAKAAFGVVFGYLLSYNIYLFLFGWFVDNYTWMLWLFLIIGMGWGLDWYGSKSNYDEEAFMFGGLMIGMYATLRSVDLLFGWGGIPNEFEVMNMMGSDNFSFSFWSFLLCLIIQFLGVMAAGTYQEDKCEIYRVLNTLD